MFVSSWLANARAVFLVPHNLQCTSQDAVNKEMYQLSIEAFKVCAIVGAWTCA